MERKENPDLSSHLNNIISITMKQDQIVWTIFSIFCAANALLLGALFTSGDFPRPEVGKVISIAGCMMSGIWFIIQRRAVNLLTFYEEIIYILESCHYVNIPKEVSISPGLNVDLFEKIMKSALTDKLLDIFLSLFGEKHRIRRLLGFCAFLAALLWGWAWYWFTSRSF